MFISNGNMAFISIERFDRYLSNQLHLNKEELKNELWMSWTTPINRQLIKEKIINKRKINTRYKYKLLRSLVY